MIDRRGPGWIAIIIVIVVMSLLLSPATMMLALPLMTGDALRVIENAEGDPIVIVGAGNSGNTFAGASHGRLARTLAGLDDAPQISDVMLRRMLDSIWNEAQRGDVDAAAVIARIAEIQRRPPK